MKSLVLFAVLTAAFVPITSAFADSPTIFMCKACHSPGQELLGPSLVGQDEKYIFAQLKKFRDGSRTQSVMNPFLKAAPDVTLKNLAHYFAALNACDFDRTPPNPLGGNLERGQSVSKSCLECHVQRALNAPRLDGLPTLYIIKQLGNFKNGERHSGIMNVKAPGLSDQDVVDVAAYFNSISACDASH
jgi:cytochrome c553